MGQVSTSEAIYIAGKNPTHNGRLTDSVDIR